MPRAFPWLWIQETLRRPSLPRPPDVQRILPYSNSATAALFQNVKTPAQKRQRTLHHGDGGLPRTCGASKESPVRSVQSSTRPLAKPAYAKGNIAEQSWDRGGRSHAGFREDMDVSPATGQVPTGKMGLRRPKRGNGKGMAMDAAAAAARPSTREGAGRMAWYEPPTNRLESDADVFWEDDAIQQLGAPEAQADLHNLGSLPCSDSPSVASDAAITSDTPPSPTSPHSDDRSVQPAWFSRKDLTRRLNRLPQLSPLAWLHLCEFPSLGPKLDGQRHLDVLLDLLRHAKSLPTSTFSENDVRTIDQMAFRVLNLFLSNWRARLTPKAAKVLCHACIDARVKWTCLLALKGLLEAEKARKQAIPDDRAGGSSTRSVLQVDQSLPRLLDRAVVFVSSATLSTQPNPDTASFPIRALTLQDEFARQLDGPRTTQNHARALEAIFALIDLDVHADDRSNGPTKSSLHRTWPSPAALELFEPRHDDGPASSKSVMARVSELLTSMREASVEPDIDFLNVLLRGLSRYSLKLHQVKARQDRGQCGRRVHHGGQMDASAELSEASRIFDDARQLVQQWAARKRDEEMRTYAGSDRSAIAVLDWTIQECRIASMEQEAAFGQSRRQDVRIPSLEDYVYRYLPDGARKPTLDAASLRDLILPSDDVRASGVRIPKLCHALHLFLRLQLLNRSFEPAISTLRVILDLSKSLPTLSSPTSSFMKATSSFTSLVPGPDRQAISGLIRVLSATLVDTTSRYIRDDDKEHPSTGLSDKSHPFSPDVADDGSFTFTLNALEITLDTIGPWILSPRIMNRILLASADIGPSWTGSGGMERTLRLAIRWAEASAGSEGPLDGKVGQRPNTRTARKDNLFWKRSAQLRMLRAVLHPKDVDVQRKWTRTAPSGSSLPVDRLRMFLRLVTLLQPSPRARPSAEDVWMVIKRVSDKKWAGPVWREQWAQLRAAVKEYEDDGGRTQEDLEYGKDGFVSK